MAVVLVVRAVARTDPATATMVAVAVQAVTQAMAVKVVKD
jgi:hypothetical protein